VYLDGFKEQGRVKGGWCPGASDRVLRNLGKPLREKCAVAYLLH
jgi:hypothetical protein